MCTKVRKINLFPVCSAFFLCSGRFRAFACRPPGRRSPCLSPEPVPRLFAESLRAATLRPAMGGAGAPMPRPGAAKLGPSVRTGSVYRRCGFCCAGPFSRSRNVRTGNRPIVPCGAPQQGDGASGTSVRGAGERFPCGAVREPFAAVPKKTARSAVCSRPCMSGGGPTRRGCFLDGHPPAAGFRALRFLRPGERKGRDKNF